jgi:hypothetical protein
MALHQITVSEEQYEHLVDMLLVVLSHTLLATPDYESPHCSYFMVKRSLWETTWPWPPASASPWIHKFLALLASLHRQGVHLHRSWHAASRM